MLAHKTFYKIGQPSMNFVLILNVASPRTTSKTLIDGKLYATIYSLHLFNDKSVFKYIYIYIYVCIEKYFYCFRYIYLIV